MITKTYKVKGRNLSDSISGFVKGYNHSAVESTYTGGFLRVWEEYSYINRNEIMVCVRVDTSKADEGVIIVEVISGGRPEGLFTGSLFSRGRTRIRDFGKELQAFCQERSIELDNE